MASPLTKAGPGVGCQDVGHTHAYTEESLRRTVLGCRKRGVPADGPYDHASGRGFVDFHPGDYYDALRRKNNQVVLLLVEVFGGLAGGGARLLRFTSRRAKDKKRGRDGTKYSKFHPENYLSHHLSAISMAAVYADACHIDDGVTGLKQDAHAAGSSDEE